MYDILLHTHSILRWVVLVLLIATAIISLKNWLTKTTVWQSPVTRIFTFNTIFLHVQLVLGFILFFISPKMNFDGDWKANKIISFFTMQHVPSMLLAIILVTVGGALAKRRDNITMKYKLIAIFNIIALILILSNIPWPYKNVGAALY